MNITPTAPGRAPGFYVVDSGRLVDPSKHVLPDAARKRAAYLAHSLRRTFYVLARYDIGGDAVRIYTCGDARSVADALLGAIASA